MAERVRLAMVGCGGMGRRHLTGLAELARTEFRNADLVAVCDLNRQNAEDLADEALEHLGVRPQVFTDAAQMVREVELDGADCPTDTGSHHAAAAMLLDLGLHTLCEKPLALTIRGCNAIIAAAERSGKLLSVAENFRRDPINRLVRALLDDGAIGDRQFIMETDIGGRDDMMITPWRHQKMTGTIPLDAGVHNADLLQYYFGEAASAFGQVRLYEKTRYVRNTAGPGGFYQKWAANLPKSFEATGEDAIFGLITFASGALGQWVNHHAGHGAPVHSRTIYGTRGSITPPGDRNGRPIRLTLDDGTTIADERILGYAPSYRLSPVAARLFGGERVWTYNYDFPVTDRKILALEYHEFAECIRTGAQPEVDGAVARRDVALVYALFESHHAGRPVTIEEVETSAVDAYQREIDEHLGLIAKLGE
ncbi:MAG: Gfo/Idh/MocA family oxidoreductase [Thermomicrobia bacterium]|nr:Gfo/Idh/MocA family oxidoreductase [Thermomicrobia bacterium]MCA1725004.1 Gfo/Idh/MocA family oxidoreductase [Thermomicrobia bacterium]